MHQLYDFMCGLHHPTFIAMFLLCATQSNQWRENHPHQQADQEPAQLLCGTPGWLLQGEPRMHTSCLYIYFYFLDIVKPKGIALSNTCWCGVNTLLPVSYSFDLVCKRAFPVAECSTSRMYLGTSYQCMFQPQDQIEVGEDGFKQYDGKPGFLWKVCVCVCVCFVVRLLYL